MKPRKPESPSRELPSSALLLTILVGIMAAPAAVGGGLFLSEGNVLPGLGLMAAAAAQILLMAGFYRADWRNAYYLVGIGLVLVNCGVLQFFLEGMAAGH